MRSQLIGVSLVSPRPCLPTASTTVTTRANSLAEKYQLKWVFVTPLGLVVPLRTRQPFAPAWRASFNSGNRFWLETGKSRENMQIQKLSAGQCASYRGGAGTGPVLGSSPA